MFPVSIEDNFLDLDSSWDFREDQEELRRPQLEKLKIQKDSWIEKFRSLKLKNQDYFPIE